MEFLSLAKQRCSVRKYKTDEIEKENQRIEKRLKALFVTKLFKHIKK